jgi:hypothetical protein
MLSIKRLIGRKLGVFFHHARLTEGLLIGSNLPFRCLFVDDSALSDYMMPRIYSEAPKIVKKWRIYVPALKKMLQSSSAEIDMCIAVLPLSWDSEFAKLPGFKTQEWVTQIIDLADYLQLRDHRVRKTYREAERIIRKYNISSRISRDLKDFEMFYNRMYLPLMKKQFGELFDREPYEDMLRIFRAGHLMQILQGDEVIACSLLFVKGDTLIGRRMGVLDARTDLIKKGVQSLIYYFGINYAIEHDLKKHHVMTSRPFFSDGVYSHKRNWGATVYPFDESGNWVYLFCPKKSQKTFRFFEKNPMIVNTDDGLAGLIGCDSKELTAEQKKEMMKKYYSPGLKRLMLLDPDSANLSIMHFRDLQVSDDLKAAFPMAVKPD